jgi:c-di-GMP-binding flagellar brake protein YcgR
MSFFINIINKLRKKCGGVLLERRRSIRYKAFYSLLLRETSDDTNPIQCRSFNISQGGIGIYGQSRIEPGKIYKFEIKLPDSEDHMVVTAEVKWVKKISSCCYNTGTSFVDIHPRDTEKLVNCAFAGGWNL